MHSNSKTNGRDNMHLIRRLAILSVLAATLMSCYAIMPKPTATPVPTQTNVPAPTSTPEPTSTPAPVQDTATAPVSGLSMPLDKPLSEWEGIPVMPDAIAGDSAASGYSYTIKAPPEDIQAFYEKELAKLGWKLLGSGQGTTKTIILIFTKDSGTVSVAIIPLPTDLMYVVLAK